ncbi:hypothetical protein FACS189452_09470 [Bacteroidia bacterium]|nr:hypothetical protein FACS189452_09470 [Bacteroidia bacterium]GHT80509.1 hypothetical protein FACS189467_2840 [Bacteroidia bacterium]
MQGVDLGAFAVDAEAVFTAVDATTIYWYTSVQTTPMAQTFATEFVVDQPFALTVVREGDKLVIIGTGTANNTGITPIDVDGTIDANGNLVMNLVVGGAPGPLKFVGTKQ